MSDLKSASIKFEVVNPKLISVNDQYYHPVKKCKDGRYRSYFCPSKSLKEFQSFYDEVLKDKIPDSFIDSIKSLINEYTGISLYLEIGFPRSDLYENDASNLVKSLEDSIARRIGIDDCRNIKVTVEKSFVEDDSTFLRVMISSYDVLLYKRSIFDEKTDI